MGNLLNGLYSDTTPRGGMTSRGARAVRRKYSDRVSEVWLEEDGGLLWVDLKPGWECVTNPGLTSLVAESLEDMLWQLGDTEQGK